MIYTGDCLDIMPTLPADSVDSIVTDPPYGLSFMGKDWDHGIPGVQFWREALRVAKPGAFLLAFGGTRTFHRLAVAIEDAGWEMRDTVMWVYGSGFPKSLDVGKAIDKANGREFADRYELGKHIRECREMLGISRKEVNERFNAVAVCNHWEAQDRNNAMPPTPKDWAVLKEWLGCDPKYDELVSRIEAEREIVGVQKNAMSGWDVDGGTKFADRNITAPATPEAKAWDGWGTALKPAWEPIIVARKPLIGTVAENVLRYGTGAINVDGSRVMVLPDELVTDDGRRVDMGRETIAEGYDRPNATMFRTGKPAVRGGPSNSQGRWPSNLIHDGSDEVTAGFPGNRPSRGGAHFHSDGFAPAEVTNREIGYGDTGSAARFFYQAKEGRAERLSLLTCDCETVKLCSWVKQDQSQSEQTGRTSQKRDTSERTSTGDSFSSTLQFGNENTDQSQQGMDSTISTGTSSTTGSKISNSSRPQNTSEYTEDANSETENGTSRAVFAGECFQSLPETFICPPRDGRFTGVVVGATSPLLSGVRRCEGCGSEVRRTSHPTQKPVALMRYLVKLVTRRGGVVLDPFMGSGSTGKACAHEGMEFIGIDLSPEYCEIAARRIAAVVQPALTG